MIGALAFLTVFGRGRVPGPRDVAWFPFVGFLLGSVLGGAWVGASELWPPLLAAALVVALDLVLTGMLHLDGLADAADGLLPHMERDRRLHVMREPGVGAFGVGVAVTVLGLRVAALASMEPRFVALVVLWATSRTLMALTLQWVPYAREAGLASAFRGPASPRWCAVLCVPLVLVLAGSQLGWPAVAAVAAALVAGAGVVALGRARVGGYTGDVVGAAGMVAETVGLVVLAAKW